MLSSKAGCIHLELQSCLSHLGVIWVVGPGKRNDARADKAAHVVHVAVDNLCVALHAAPQPDDLFEAQIVLQHLHNPKKRYVMGAPMTSESQVRFLAPAQRTHLRKCHEGAHSSPGM